MKHPTALALGPGVIVWSAIGQGKAWISVESRSGKEPRELAKDLPVVRALVVRGDDVYFAAATGIGRVALAGGEVTWLVKDIEPRALVVTDKLYWLEPGYVASAPLAGGETTVLYQGSELAALAVADGNVYIGGRHGVVKDGTPFAPIEMCTNSIVVHAGTVYTPSCHVMLVTTPVAGGASVVMSRSIRFASDMVLNGDKLVIANGGEQDSYEVLPLGETSAYPHNLGCDKLAADPAEPGVVYCLGEGKAKPEGGHISRISL